MTVKPLANLRVLELSSTVAAAYCGRLLAGFGAQVTRLPAAGDPCRDYPPAVRSALAAYLHAGKEELAPDPAGSALTDELLAGVDALVEDLPADGLAGWGLDYRRLLQAHPRLVITSISPFGRTGPYSGYKAGELVVFHLAGLAHMTPREIGDRSDRRHCEPLKGPGQVAHFYAGLSAAGATLAALFARLRTGQGQQADVSIIECLLPTLRRELAINFYRSEVPSRFARSRGIAPLGIRPCKDGHVLVQIMEQRQWQGLVDMMGNPAWAADERFRDQESRYRHAAALDPLVNAWLAGHTKEEIYRAAQQRKVPFAAVNSIADLFTFPQLKEHGYFAPGTAGTLEPACPARFSSFCWGVGE